MQFRHNAFREYNMVGAFLLTLSVFLTALFATSPKGPGGALIVGPPLILGSLFLIFYRVEVEIADGTVRQGRGVWPFLAWHTLALADAQEILLSGSRGKSLIVRVELVFPERKVALSLGEGKGGLRRVIDFARSLKLPFRITPQLAAVSPPWFREIVPEPFADR